MPPKKVPSNEGISQFFRRRQAELGLTFAEIAEKMTANGYNVTGETVRRWTHTGAIPLDALAAGGEAIAAAYGVAIEDIIYLAGGQGAGVIADAVMKHLDKQKAI